MFYIFYLLFYFQATTTTQQYTSDLPAHITFAQNLFSTSKVSYPLFHCLILILNMLPFINLDSGAAIVLGVSCICTSIIIRWAFIKLCHKNKSSYLIDALSICLIMVFSLYIPSYSKNIYYAIGGINVWHNPTYLAVKPFAVLSFFLFVFLYDKYMAKEKYMKNLLGFAVITFLSALAKPSYIFVFLPALAIFLIIELIVTKFKTFKFSLWITLCVIPSLILLYYQFASSYGSQHGGIIFKLGGIWSNNLKNVIVSIILVNCFSLYVLIFGGFKDIIRDKKYLLAVLTALAGGIEFFLFTEYGPMANCGNLAWGYFIGALIFITISAYKFFFEAKQNTFFRNIGLGIFTIQVITGIYYFTTLLMGNSYL